jgi:hypothetical protein
VAAAETLFAAEPEQRIVARAEPRTAESRQAASTPADVGPPPVREEPPLKEPEAETPPDQKSQTLEHTPPVQQTPPPVQTPPSQQTKPQEQKSTGSLLDQPPTGQSRAGQQPGVPPGGVKPLEKQGQGPGMVKPLEANFMGVKAFGSRICIIADCSGSMAYNNRMKRLKAELKKTVEALSPEQEFFIIYFSDSATPMRTRRNKNNKIWQTGGEELKKVFNWIDNQPPGGGTEPMPAFEFAFRLKPRPDAIYFLTDGLIPVTTPQGVARLNGAKNKVPIHTILFGGELAGVEERVVMVPVNVRGKITMVPRRVPVAKVEKDVGQLQQVSRDSGGTHRFIPDEGKPGR